MGYEPQAAFGPPQVVGTASVTLSIDGRAVSVPAGTSVMRAAAEIGGAIPKLCATDNVAAFGSCRMCLVEVDGMRGTPASCTTLVADGMVVRTQTPRLEKLRKGVMELYISDHPLDCLTCSANNDCELQDTAAQVGLRDVRYGYTGANHLGLEADTSNPYFDFDPSKCIVCSRCVRACEEVQGTFALTILRGLRGRLSHRHLERKGRRPDRQARTLRHHNLRLLRGRLHLSRRNAGGTTGAHGAVEGWQGQPGA